MEKRASDAKTMRAKGELRDDVEVDLYVRYSMSPQIWRKSQRDYFPYNVKIEWICGIPLVAPLVFLLCDLTIIDQNLGYLKIILQTICVSLFAFYISDKMIIAFKDNLESKGLFGRDLNKAGI